MDRDESPNPYVASPIEPAESRFGRVGIVFGVFGLLTGLAPSLYILYGLIAMWWQLATMNDPPASIRPMGLSVAIFMAMGAGLMFCTPISLACSWIANRLGSPAGAELAKSGAALFLLPFAIGVGGMFLMCLFTGVELGS